MEPLTAVPCGGTDDRPVLLRRESRPEFDINDVDGPLFMLDPEWGGTVQVAFSKPMDPTVPGTVVLDGDPVDYVLKALATGRGTSWLLGIKVFGVLTEYGREYPFHLEGFADTDGNVMAPTGLVVVTRSAREPEPEFAEYERLARRVAQDGIVLLKNTGDVLPLDHGQLNVFGRALHFFRTAVVGAGKINARYTVGLREAIDRHGGFILNRELSDFYRTGGDTVPGPAMLARAKARSNAGIVVLTRSSGENMDNSSAPGEYYLSADEESLIRSVAETFDRTVVLLNTPYPIDVTFAERYGVDALLLAGVGGMLAGPALLDVLDGTANPSGRLPDTWPKDITDVPAHRNFYDGAGGKPRHTGDAEVWIDTVYEEGVYVGYRYFTTFGVEAAYPFGHGLSYTTFAIEPGPPRVDGDRVSLSAMVTNTGAVAGREVVQVYVAKPEGDLDERPVRELVDFGKTPALAPGECHVLAFDLPFDRLTGYDERAGAHVAAAGRYRFHVGRSVVDTVEAGAVDLRQPVGVRPVGVRLAPAEPITVLSSRDPVGTWPTGGRSGVKPVPTAVAPADRTGSVGSPQAGPAAPVTSPVTFADVWADPALAGDFVAGLTVEQLARLSVCGQAGWGMEGIGVAGILARPEGLDMPLFQVADGNSGVNVNVPNTGFPTTVVLASTFDKELAESVGRAIGEEARDVGIQVLLAPALNLHRHPLNGRHPEYFSEDPLLAGLMAGHYARGVESAGVGACYKHLAANNAESARKRNQSLVPERALRELYLKAFEVALSVHRARTVMTSYNALNGRPASASAELLRGVLRQDFGFDGMVMSDWNAYDTCAVVEMVAAGNNWITPGSPDDVHTAPIVAAVADGSLSPERLRASVTHVVRVVAELADRPDAAVR
ncbi:glycoside hydrolase family 3 protein [Streptomyces sp. NPDC096310]|uniref:glycoside hydrolase family 3 protein n=1 Tax=Streptomyces sp. NPDC096310 TaxID=3366082 RepID=UPI0038186495